MSGTGMDQCARCGGDCAYMAPVALYRKMDGVSVFTGFVKRGDNLFKLHDVWGDLDGDAHEATSPEFLSQMALYDGSEDKRYQKPIPTISVASKDNPYQNGGHTKTEAIPKPKPHTHKTHACSEPTHIPPHGPVRHTHT